jgi:hypothetical protein
MSDWRSDPMVRAKLMTLTEEWMNASSLTDDEVGEAVYTLFETREELRRSATALAVAERERDKLRAALDRIAKAHAPAEHLQGIARDALAVSPEGEA